MRKLSNLFGIALLALAGITISSCSDDNESTGKHISGDQSFILKISSHVPADSLFEDNQPFRARLSAAGFNEDNIISISGKDSVDIKSKLDATMKKVATNLTSKNETPFKLSVYRINNDATEEKSSNVCWYEEAFNHDQNSIFKSVNACEFQYEEKTLYATDIAVVNKDRGDLKSMPSGYSQVDKDLNDGAGGDYIYMGIKFEEYNESHKNQYITDVITLASTKHLDNNYTINYNGRTYKMATGGELDLNANAGGDWIYIMYTRDKYEVNGKEAYLVNTAEDGYVQQHYRQYNPDGITNTTRLVYTYTWFSSEDFNLSDQNIGQYDRCVKMIDNNGKDLGDADFNRKAGGEYMKMVCAYDYAPMADYANWASYINGEILLSELSIPGTYDSFTWEQKMVTTNTHTRSCHNQALNIKEQWEAGIRAFDVHIGANYEMQSGEWRCYDKDKVISVIDGFKMIGKQLDAHPGEFAIIFVSYAGNSDSSMPKEWKDLVRYAEMSVFGEENVVSFVPGLTLNDVRGKVIIFHDDLYPSNEVAEHFKTVGSSVLWADYTQNNEISQVWSYDMEKKDYIIYNSHMLVQNTLNTDSYKTKVERFKQLANTFFDYRWSPTWAINLLCGSSPITAKFASDVNEEIYPFIKENKGKRFGIVIGDFMGVNSCTYKWSGPAGAGNARTRGRAVTRALIENNDKYLKSK